MKLLLLITLFNTSFAGDRELVGEIQASMRQAADFLLREAQGERGQARGDFEIATRTWSEYETAWHTGQLALAYYRSYDTIPDPRYLEGARRAADYWLNLFVDDKSSPLRGYLFAVHGAEWPDWIVTATITDGAPGIYEYYLRTKDPRVPKVFDSVADWMWKNLWIAEEGLLFDFVDKTSGSVHGLRRDIYPLHKVARPNIEGSFFRLAWKLTGKKRYRDVYRAQCDTTLREQDRNGILARFEPNLPGYIHPRFNLWNAEALLECHEEFGKARFLEGAKRTADFYLSRLDAYGRVCFPDPNGQVSPKDAESASAFAFTGLLLLEISKRERQTGRYLRETGAIAQWLTATQINPADGWPTELGGAYRDLKKAGYSVNRDLGTIFGLRFLAAYQGMFL